MNSEQQGHMAKNWEVGWGEWDFLLWRAANC